MDFPFDVNNVMKRKSLYKPNESVAIKISSLNETSEFFLEIDENGIITVWVMPDGPCTQAYPFLYQGIDI